MNYKQKTNKKTKVETVDKKTTVTTIVMMKINSMNKDKVTAKPQTIQMSPKNKSSTKTE